MRSYVPTDDAAEASLIEGLDAHSFPSLLALVDHLTSHARLAPFQRDLSLGDPDALPPYAADLAEVKGPKYQHKELTITEDKIQFQVSRCF